MVCSMASDVQIYDTDVTWVRSLVDLSPLSVAKMAQMFKCNRVNLFGILAGRLTLGKDRYIEFLEWMGIDRGNLPKLESSTIKLTLKPGLYVWEVTSPKKFRALLNALQLFDLGSLEAELLMTADIPDRDVVRMCLKSNTLNIVLSLSAHMVPLARETLKQIRTPKTFGYIPERYSALLVRLGVHDMGDFESGNHEFWGMRLDPKLIVHKTQNDEIRLDARPDHFEDWMGWLRREMQVDTTQLMLPKVIGTLEKPSQFSAQTTYKSDREQQIASAWLVFQQALDVGKGSHPSVSDVPVYHLGEVHEFPKGMIRLHRCILGEELLQLAKEYRLRLYLEPENRSSIYMVAFKNSQKAAPLRLDQWSGTDRPIRRPSDPHAHQFLRRHVNQDPQFWSIGSFPQQHEAQDIFAEGIVVATLTQNISAVNLL